MCTSLISLCATALQPITVSYSMSGNAVLGADCTLTGAANQIIIPAGQSSGKVTLTVTTTKTKGREKAIMTLNTGSGYQLPKLGKKKKVKRPKATVTINNK